jgi:pimeloyl-ACP methyl ester carboxylesterase
MTNDAPRDPLREALRDLPRAVPEGDFTDRVLVASGDAPRARRLVPAATRWAAVAALAAFAVAGSLTLPALQDEHGAQRRRQARHEAFEAERQRLAAELEEIRRLAATAPDPSPVLYLGGDEDVDLVLDLGRLAERRPAGATPTDYRDRPNH